MFNNNGILCSLLECGYADLNMLNKCNYEYEEIEKHIIDVYGEDTKITLTKILCGAIIHYKSRVQNKIDEMIFELECEIKDMEQWYDDVDVKINIEDKVKLDRLWKEKEDLENLNAYDDIEEFINYIDTHIYINDEELKAIYNKYLSDYIKEENEEIGFVSLDLD